MKTALNLLFGYIKILELVIDKMVAFDRRKCNLLFSLYRYRRQIRNDYQKNICLSLIHIIRERKNWLTYLFCKLIQQIEDLLISSYSCYIYSLVIFSFFWFYCYKKNHVLLLLFTGIPLQNRLMRMILKLHSNNAKWIIKLDAT